MPFQTHTPTQTHSQDESSSEEPAEAMGEKWPGKSRDYAMVFSHHQ